MYIRSVVDSEEKSLQNFAQFKQAPARNTVIDSLAKYCTWPTHIDRFSLKFAFSGTESYTVRHRNLTVERDRLLVVNAGQPYAGHVRAAEWVHSLAIYFDPQLLQVAAEAGSDEALLANPLGCTGPTVWFHETELTARPRLRHRLVALQQRLALAPTSELELEERLFDLLRELMRTHGRQVHRTAERLSAIKPVTRLEIYRRLHVAKEFIEAQATEEVLTLEAIAAVSMLSKNHLLRHFRELFRHSPHQYVTSVRLAKAKDLLIQSALPVQEISLHTGFESPSSFGRLFKSVFTLTPQQYRLQGSR